MAPHFGLVSHASSEGQPHEYVFCDFCSRQEQNGDLAENYCLLHRPGQGQTPDGPSLRDDQVEDAIKTILLAACEVLKEDFNNSIQTLLIPSAESPHRQLSSSSSKVDNQDSQPIESCSSPPQVHENPRQGAPAQQPPLPQAVSSIPHRAHPGRKGPGRRAIGLRINLPNPSPLPPRGTRPDPELLASYGVIIPHIPLVPGLRPSKQPGTIAADLAWSKAIRICTNCHKPVDDPQCSKCSRCRKAGNERAKKYQKRKKKEKAGASGVSLQTIANDSQNAIQSGEGAATRTRTRASAIATRITTSLPPLHDEYDVASRDRIYMTLIDTLRLHHRPSVGQPSLGPGREHAVYLEALDRLTDIRLAATAQYPQCCRSAPLPPASEAPVGTDSQGTEQRDRRTLPREQLDCYSNDYFLPEHRRTPKTAIRTSSNSMPTPAQPSPSHPPRQYRSSPGLETMKDEQDPLHPQLTSIPPEQWRSLPSWQSLPGLESPTTLSVQLGYPSNWDATTESRYQNYHYRQQFNLNYSQQEPSHHHRAYRCHDANSVNNSSSSGGGGGNNGSRSWVNGPSAEAVVVDPALSRVQEGMGVSPGMGELSGDLEDLDIEEFVNLSGLEEGGDWDSGDGESREGGEEQGVYFENQQEKRRI
ncbi:hypothetical protein QBC36DRAFT_369409 [Triangularia setosa]|uniref:Uncharacterized protein n=1 Tax=Triangularia setosa TaxID=2587417 RepID=A0AAN6WA23_9PEZI|nr:hypothetical protein QBC36DRAFT_369409 [Podospora setosa]